jgi:hypothetical protein
MNLRLLRGCNATEHSYDFFFLAFTSATEQRRQDHACHGTQNDLNQRHNAENSFRRLGDPSYFWLAANVFLVF